jgi:RimJ/RimL family protein N-acetyltransferase
MLTLETERHVLREFAMTDWDALNTILTVPLVTRYMHFASWDEDQRRAWLARIVQEAQDPHRAVYNRVITLRSGCMLIGWLGIGGTTHPSAEGARGRFLWHGYLQGAVFAYEFSVLGTRRIIAECETQNTASARVMQKSGVHY